MRVIAKAAIVVIGAAGVLAVDEWRWHSGPRLEGAARVVDGDTVVIAGERVRLVGIDAYERGQSCGSVGVGELARAVAHAAAAGGAVSCATVGRDRYGRALGRCWAGGNDLAGVVVGEGLAELYDVRHGWRYAADFARAVIAGKRSVTGAPCQSPGDYRRAVKLPGAR